MESHLSLRGHLGGLCEEGAGVELAVAGTGVRQTQAKASRAEEAVSNLPSAENVPLRKQFRLHFLQNCGSMNFQPVRHQVSGHSLAEAVGISCNS